MNREVMSVYVPSTSKMSIDESTFDEGDIEFIQVFVKPV